MKKREIKELRSKNLKELTQSLKNLKSELAKIIIERNARRLKNTALVRGKKKDVARILTVIREKELEKV